jgi:DNA-binding response OmpR family regulator
MLDVKGLNVLVVEDDEIQSKLIEELLRQAGLNFVSVKDGHTALDKLTQEKFNLVISDVNMPGISGFNLVKTVRGLAHLKDIPFIFVTGRRRTSDVARAIDSGVDDYIVKPIDRDMLLAKIESLVSKKGKVFAFSERPARSTASLSINFEIDGVSEQAIQFASPIPLPLNYKLKIASDLFDEIGIAAPRLRVASSDVESNERNLYRIRASFIGLNETEMSAIRKWTMLNQPKIKKNG